MMSIKIWMDSCTSRESYFPQGRTYLEVDADDVMGSYSGENTFGDIFEEIS